MGKTEIKVGCNDQVLKITESPVLAAGGLNEVRIAFNFCEKWAGFVKTAIFYRNEEDVFYAVLDENDTCIVPWEVCYEEGTFYFGVFGEKGSIRRTTNVVRYKVKKGAITSDMQPSDPTPDVYDQIIAEIANIRTENKAFVEEVNNTLDNAVKHNVKSIEKTATEGLVDTYTITFIDGSAQTYTVTNGENGGEGDPGKDGYTPVKGVDYFDGVNGQDGKTPVKGVDYWTESDKNEIIKDFTEQTAPISYKAQELDDNQKAQARENLYVPSTADFDDLSLTVSRYRNELEEADYQLGLRVDELEKGGGEYELIETITLTEPMSIQRSQEPDGTPYKFRGLRVFVKSNANEQANLNFYLYNSKKSGYAQGTFGSISAGNTVTKYAYVQMENAHGLWQDSWYVFGDNIGASAKFANSYRTLALNTDFSKYDYVASILSSTAVAAGTTIEIWGWRL